MAAELSTNSQSPIINGPLSVAVLMGGVGEERDISLESGRCVTQALREAGLNVTAADIAPDDLHVLDNADIDVFFIALHGRFGEDGQLQQLLEDRSLVYTGSGPQASRLAFDKLAAKQRFAEAGVRVPKAIRFDDQVQAREFDRRLLQLGERFVVKPLRQGSTIGVTIVHDSKSALSAARECSSRFGDCMIEQFIPGREITIGILENRALPIIEIKSKTGFYDYRAKYLDERTEFLFDTIHDAALRGKIKAAAMSCFTSLGCRHFARVDLILSEQGRPYVLEVNTIPGFTSHSLLPMAAAKTGLSMARLCIRIIEAALANKNSPASLLNQVTKSQR